MDDESQTQKPPAIAEVLRAQWVEAMEEFKLMTWAAQRGYKRACGGHPDRDDMDAYDLEAEACTRLRDVLAAVELAPDATAEEARSQALAALEIHHQSQGDTGRAPGRQFLWARAVVEGDASRYWNSYHPRFAARPGPSSEGSKIG